MTGTLDVANRVEISKKFGDILAKIDSLPESLHNHKSSLTEQVNDLSAIIYQKDGILKDLQLKGDFLDSRLSKQLEVNEQQHKDIVELNKMVSKLSLSLVQYQEAEDAIPKSYEQSSTPEISGTEFIDADKEFYYVTLGSVTSESLDQLRIGVGKSNTIGPISIVKSCDVDQVPNVFFAYRLKKDDTVMCLKASRDKKSQTIGYIESSDYNHPAAYYGYFENPIDKGQEPNCSSLNQIEVAKFLLCNYFKPESIEG